MKNDSPARINQTITGKAYEYACVQAIVSLVGSKRPVHVLHNSSLSVASGAWASLDDDLRDIMNKSAIAGIESLIQLEPKILEDGQDELELQLQDDKKGREGDVRDVLILRHSIKWEIGISVKHNHNAVKHSRLSQKINFGKDWLLLDNSKEYFNAIEPIFSRLEDLKAKGLKWSEVQNKDTEVYVPVLHAFMNELQRLNTENPQVVTARLLEYLLGRKDFYKIISDDSARTTMLQCFNLNGTLNTASSSRQPSLRVKGVVKPTRIYYLDFKDTNNGPSTTTVQLVMDNNWAISFRIHSASTYVEPSLKFDIQLTGVPSSMFSNSVSW